MRKLVKLSDALTLAGLCSLGYGLYLFRPWVSFVVCGALVIAAGLLLSADEEKTP